jgi:ATP-dependent DNA helicase RecG
MLSILPIGIEELLAGAVESVRLELKATWSEDTVGHQVIKTLCAYANDLQNLNGGYIVLGVRESGGLAVRPVNGLSDDEIDRAQKWIRGNCRHIDPEYVPVMDAPRIDGRRVLVLWAPASDFRPHQAPDGPRGDRKYWVRVGSETIAAKDAILTRVIQQSARVPFDDRRAFDATVEDLRISLVREFLRDVRSDLVSEPDADRIYSAMQLLRKQNSHRVPRNVALLFFTDDPTRWFRCAHIEAARFADDAGGDTIDENRFSGPIQQQVRQCIVWLENLSIRHIEKREQTPEAKGWVSFPAPALREAVVNAIYHRSYEDTVEPSKVYLYPDRIEVISYPGPVDGIERMHFLPGAAVPPVPARNRRIGEFLKDLRLAEGRGTGLPKIVRSMRENGSPDPIFDFDDSRSYFRVTLLAHPEFVARVRGGELRPPSPRGM